MRHLKKRNTLGRAADQRKALLRGLSQELIIHGKIKTTLTKAKVLRSFVEKIITKAKKANQAEEKVQKYHYIRLIRKLINKEALRKVLKAAEKLKDRNGGYTRILKLASRKGDNAPMSLIQILED